MSEAAFRRVWVIGFAGHRRLPDAPAVRASILQALRGLRDGLEGELTARSSAAAGADLLFLECCRELGLAYSVVLPFQEERFREDFDDPEELARAKEAIDQAADVEIAPGNEVAPEAYHLAAREIVDVADVMLFVWNGKPPLGIGGTGESVAESAARGIPYQVIDADSGSLGALQGSRPLPWRDLDFADIPKLPSVKMVFGELDRRAVRGAPRARWFAAGSISLNQVATVISAVLVAFKLGEDAAPVVKFLIVTLAACLPWVGARFRINDSWVEERLQAELLRSLMASHSFSPPLRPFAADLFQADAPLLRSAAWMLIGQRAAWSAERDRYLAERLDGQIDYLSIKGELAARRLRVFWTAFRIASIGAMTLGALAIFRGVSGWQVPEHFSRVWLMFLPTVLPALAGWCLAMIPLFEHKRRANLYRQMVVQLQAKRTELVEAKCRTTAAAVVASCERLLLTELWEWSGTRGKRKR